MRVNDFHIEAVVDHISCICLMRALARNVNNRFGLNMSFTCETVVSRFCNTNLMGQL